MTRAVSEAVALVSALAPWALQPGEALAGPARSAAESLDSFSVLMSGRRKALQLESPLAFQLALEATVSMPEHREGPAGTWVEWVRRALGHPVCSRMAHRASFEK